MKTKLIVIATLGAGLALAACVGSNEAPRRAPFVTIGGTVSGLSGTVVLQNNNGGPLAADANGHFTFTTLFAPGAAYSVTVQTQPAGQTCSVTNGSGIANGNVTSVTVLCEGPGPFVIRPLPVVYTTGKAINYGAYRAGGPGAGEIPSDAAVLQDLGLLSAAGYNLVRIFGSDAVGEKVLRLAAANYPAMQFQLGIFLNGLPPGAACDSSPITASQIDTAIRLAGQYPNVATVSVGNETSFYRSFLPISCLEGYIDTVRNQVTQPVTADDDYTFYTRAEADTVLQRIDFVSIHTYPFSYTGRWDWQQTGTAAGPARAAAMMNAAFSNARDTFEQVAGHLYRNAVGVTERVDASLPIVVGETGWKARQTNPGAEIESYAAHPVNEKWYYDLVYAWERTAGGPGTVFFFSAFDEAWKDIDDGWGLWDKDRAPRYVLCGTPAGAACNGDLYQGAGFYPL